MTVTIRLEEETARALQARAAAADLSLDEYLLRLADAGSTGQTTDGPIAAAAAREFDEALDELFASDSQKLPSSPSTHGRAELYDDHD